MDLLYIETDGYYEISFFKEVGGSYGLKYAIHYSKELMDKAFQSS